MTLEDMISLFPPTRPSQIQQTGAETLALLVASHREAERTGNERTLWGLNRVAGRVIGIYREAEDRGDDRTMGALGDAYDMSTRAGAAMRARGER